LNFLFLDIFVKETRRVHKSGFMAQKGAKKVTRERENDAATFFHATQQPCLKSSFKPSALLPRNKKKEQ
jgi:hypothetical protein